MKKIDSLDSDDRYYDQKKSDLDERLARMYDKIDSTKQHDLPEELISGIHVYHEQHNGKWIKSIDFRPPLGKGKRRGV